MHNIYPPPLSNYVSQLTASDSVLEHRFPFSFWRNIFDWGLVCQWLSFHSFWLSACDWLCSPLLIRYRSRACPMRISLCDKLPPSFPCQWSKLSVLWVIMIWVVTSWSSNFLACLPLLQFDYWCLILSSLCACATLLSARLTFLFSPLFNFKLFSLKPYSLCSSIPVHGNHGNRELPPDLCDFQMRIHWGVLI